MNIILKSFRTCFVVSAVLILGCSQKESLDCSQKESTDKLGSIGATTALKLEISAWGPHSVILGKSFNIQPNGQSALWLTAPGIKTGDKYEFWFGDKRINSFYTDEKTGGSVTIPSELLNLPGKFPVFLVDKSDKKRIDIGVFEVKAE